MMTRRQALKTTALVTATCAVTSPLQNLLAQSAAPATGPFTLPALPYPTDALEPHIDARTMEIHHGRHHASYVSNLNNALSSTPRLSTKDISDLVRNLNSVPENIRTAVRNNGGGHYNHLLFWQMMKKNGGGEPKGELTQAIDKKFGSFSAFKDEFTKAALGQFGSGWAWLVVDGNDLRIESTPNQDNPLTHNRTPLLGVDVWEHAYYLKYQNKRLDYVTAWFNVINWDFVAEQFKNSKS